MNKRKKTYVFSGQGIQVKKACSEVFEKYSEEVDSASNILGYSLYDLCKNAGEEVLKNTEFSQVIIYVVNALEFLDELSLNKEYPDFLIGHSLGEYNALQAAGSISFEDGLKIVKERGRLMRIAGSGSMCAVCGPSIEKIMDAINGCSNRSKFDIANLNSPRQIVISGLEEDILLAKNELEKKQMKCITLRVSGAFHSRHMIGANKKFVTFLKEYQLQKPSKASVVSATTASRYEDNVMEILQEHMVKSVNWIKSINYIIDQGAYEFKQIGKTKSLINLVDDIKFERITNKGGSDLI